ncbi:MAG: hypothetical protein HY897_24160 [Deltaproteobacteria bacterium]|nr:hypothetical protein [Deltaproteobacteria bacterium]
MPGRVDRCARAGNGFVVVRDDSSIVYVFPGWRRKMVRSDLEAEIQIAMKKARAEMETRASDAVTERFDRRAVVSRAESSLRSILSPYAPAAKPSLRTFVEGDDEFTGMIAMRVFVHFSNPDDLPYLEAFLEKMALRSEAENRDFHEHLETALFDTVLTHEKERAAPLFARMLGSRGIKNKAALLGVLVLSGTEEHVAAVDKYLAVRKAGPKPVIQFTPHHDCGLIGRGVKPFAELRPPFLNCFSNAGVVEASDGSLWLAFTDAKLGGALDIWLVQRQKNGTWGKPVFTGVTGFAEHSRSELSFSVDGQKFAFKGDFEQRCVLDGKRGFDRYKPCGRVIRNPTVLMQGLLKDSDGDGLPDLVEKRLGTNPESGDSDGDGVPDGEDADPLTPDDPSPGDDDLEIVRAVFLRANLSDVPGHELVIIDTPFLKKKPTLFGLRGFVWNNPSEKEVDELRSLVGYDGFEEVEFAPPCRKSLPDESENCSKPDSVSPIRYLDPGRTEAQVDYVSYHGGLWSHRSRCHLKKVRGKWYVTGSALLWVS